MAIFKILELCLSTLMNGYLLTSDNQYGIKQNIPLNYAYIFTVKLIIQVL